MKDTIYICNSCGKLFEKPQHGIMGEECPRCCSMSITEHTGLEEKYEKKELDPVFADILRGYFG